MRKERLADVCNLNMGQSPNSSSYNAIGEGLPFFQGNADFGESSPVATTWCTNPKKVAEPGDILLSVRAPIGAVNIADTRCCIGRGLAAISPKTSDVSTNYIKHVLLANQSKLEFMGTGSTFKAVGKKPLSNFKIPVYPTSEQVKIENRFAAIIATNAFLRDSLRKLDELVKSRFIEMFGDPLDNPKGLPIRQIKEIADVQTGATPLRSNSNYYGGSIPWVKTGEVASGLKSNAEETITELALKETNCKLFPAGTILIAMYGQGDTRGKAAILKQDAATNQACAAVLLNEGYDADFILAQLNLRYEDLRSLSLGGNQKNLSLNIIKGYQLVVPDEAQQRAFMSFKQQVDKLEFAQLASTCITNLSNLETSAHSPPRPRT